MTDETMIKARAEAVSEACCSMLKAAGSALERHGNDPLSEVILAAAVTMFIEKTDGLQPGFKRHVSLLLQHR